MPKETNDIQEFNPQHSLDYWVKTRSAEKRNYIFDYAKAKVCDHPEMKIVARGGNMYRCTECQYVHQWPGAITWPLHFSVIQGAFQMLGFAKEFGMASLQEVLRRPIGQTDGTPHKPVLPEGMGFMDVLQELEKIDVTQPDGGLRQLREMLDEIWVGPKEKALQAADSERQQRQLEEAKETQAIKGEHDNNQGDTGDTTVHPVQED